MLVTLGHPARWLDVAAAVAECENEWFVRISWKVEVLLVDKEDIHLALWCEVTPSVFSPHGGKEPIVRQREFPVGRDRPMSGEMYRLLWSCMQTVPIIWPLGGRKKGPA